MPGIPASPDYVSSSASPALRWDAHNFSIVGGCARPDGTNLPSVELDERDVESRWLLFSLGSAEAALVFANTTLSVEMAVEESPVYRGPSDIGLAFGVRNRSSDFGLFGFRQVEAGAGAQALMDTGGDIHGLEYVFRHPTSGEVHTLPTTWPVGGFRLCELCMYFCVSHAWSAVPRFCW